MGKVVRLKAPDFNDAAAQKLSSSGLTVEQGAALGMYSVANATTLDQQFEIEPALVIPYYDIDGTPMRAHKAWPEFYRIRYLGEPKHDFKEASGAKKSRYSQPRNTGVCAYFPTSVDWRAIAADTTEPILITEGELKAAKGCAEGFPTIGLGGVHNFRQSSQGVFFLPELEQVEWARRKVTIVYDSDYRTNAGICGAINTLAEELAERGALVFVAELDSVYEDDNRKTGMDDYLIEKGEDAFIEIIQQAAPLGITKHLWSMNNELVYVDDPGFVVVQRTAQKLSPPNFSGHSTWATQSTPERKLKADGTFAIVKSSAAPVWIKWPLRKNVTKLTYMPGQDRFYEDNGMTYYNQWAGWGTKPKKGDVKPYLELVKFLFEGADKAHVEWFLDWCAYPIQFPGTKMFSACLIHGRKTGTGKSLLFYTLKPIYGKNFIKIKNQDLFQTWWYENKQFVFGDEISGTDKRSEADALKIIITQEEVNVNIKYVPQFSIPDVINYGFASNHPDAMFLEDEDRRYFIHEVLAEEPLPDAFYANYDKWLKKDGGAAALMQWFLDRDLSKFNPNAPAPRTSARDRMIVLGKADLGLWVRQLKEDPDSKLWTGKMRHVRDLFTSKELLAMYEQETGSTGKVTANGMARELSNAHFIQAYDGKPIWGPDKKQFRYFVVRNKDRWKKVKDGKALTRHVLLQPVRD